jgi:NifU-like protein involved in Fe-S cluster formation
MLDLELDMNGRIARCGLAVEACALGQAAAALLARGAPGQGADALNGAAHDLAAWLRGERDAAPDWPGLSVLAGARAYPARHAAILLPFALAADLLKAPRA